MAGSKERLWAECTDAEMELLAELTGAQRELFKRYALLASRLRARTIADASAAAEETRDPPPGGGKEGGGAPHGGFSVK